VHFLFDVIIKVSAIVCDFTGVMVSDVNSPVNYFYIKSVFTSKIEK